jgi:hypothetical protein
MERSLKWLLAAVALTTAIPASSDPAVARGGAASIMNSPGYQRRLQESRQQLAPSAAQPSTHRRKTRHRH